MRIEQEAICHVALELDRKRIGYSLSTSFRNTKEVTSTLSSNIITDTSLVRQRKLIKQPVVDLTVTKSRTNALNSLGKPLSHVFCSLDSVGFTSGSEVKAAVKEAFQLGATIVLADRDIDVTMRRLSEAIKATESDRFAAMVELLSTSLDRALADPVFASQLAEVMCREVPAIHQALISRPPHGGLRLAEQRASHVLVVSEVHVHGVERHLRETGGYCVLENVNEN
eukprot:gene25540-32010_t